MNSPFWPHLLKLDLEASAMNFPQYGFHTSQWSLIYCIDQHVSSPWNEWLMKLWLSVFLLKCPARRRYLKLQLWLPLVLLHVNGVTQPWASVHLCARFWGGGSIFYCSCSLYQCWHGSQLFQAKLWNPFTCPPPQHKLSNNTAWGMNSPLWQRHPFT